MDMFCVKWVWYYFLRLLQKTNWSDLTNPKNTWHRPWTEVLAVNFWKVSTVNLVKSWKIKKEYLYLICLMFDAFILISVVFKTGGQINGMWIESVLLKNLNDLPFLRQCLTWKFSYIWTVVSQSIWTGLQCKWKTNRYFSIFSKKT